MTKYLLSPMFDPSWLGKHAALGARRVLQNFRQAAGMRSIPVASAVLAAQAAGPCVHRVLVVDDNPVNLLMATQMLSYFNVQHLVASDGAEAVALATELALDMILMDLQMPVLDGFAATRQIRACEREQQRARVPVVAYTTSTPALHVLQGCGMDGLLEKPCELGALKTCLQRWCPSALGGSAATGSSYLRGAA